MKRPKGWAVAIALQLGTCGLAGCSSTAPPLPGVGSQAAVESHQSVEQMMAAARFLENQGVQHHDPTKLEMARQGYLSVLARNPQSQYAHHRLAILAARGGLFDTAEVHFLKAKAAGGASSQLLADMGYNYYLQNRLEEAEQSLRSAVNKDSRNETAVNNLGLVLGEMGKTDEALANFEQVVGTAEAHANLAKVYTHLGRLEEAKEQYNLALSIDQNMRNAAEALVQLEDATSARRMAHQHTQQRQQMAQHRHPNQHRHEPETKVARRGRLPDFEELFGEPQARRETHVRPVSEQRPVEVPQPALEEQYFDPQAGHMPQASLPATSQQERPVANSNPGAASSAVTSAGSQASVPDVQPMHEPEVHLPPQVNMADLAATLGQAQEETATQQMNVQPAPATTRVASSANQLQASLSEPEAVMPSAPPLPTNDAEFQAFQKPNPVSQTPVTQQTVPQQTVTQQQSFNIPPGPDVYPQAEKAAPIAHNPARIVNPFVAEDARPQPVEPKTIVTPAEDELAPLPSPADEYVTNSPLPMNTTSDLPQQPKQITFASARVADDLPVGEPNLAPIAVRPTAPATKAPLANSPAVGAPMDFRVPSGAEPRSLQKLLDDEDY